MKRPAIAGLLLGGALLWFSQQSAEQKNSAQLAELIDVDLDPYRHRILINQGERHGVFVGQAVIDANGLVGQVLDVEDARATVILLSDPSHAVPVPSTAVPNPTTTSSTASTPVIVHGDSWM